MATSPGASLSEQLEGTLEVQQGGLAGIDGRGGTGCGEMGAPGLGRPVGGLPVPRCARRSIGQQSGQRGMQVAALVGQLKCLDGLRVQLVGDGQTGGRLDDQAAGQRLRASAGGDASIRQSQSQQRLARERLAGRREDSDEPRGRGGQRVHAGTHDLLERIGQAHAFQPGGRRDQLRGLQRVAARAFDDSGHQVTRRTFAQSRLDQAAELAPLERRQLDPLDGRVRAKRGGQLVRGMTPMKLLGPVADHEADGQRPTDAQQGRR